MSTRLLISLVLFALVGSFIETAKLTEQSINAKRSREEGFELERGVFVPPRPTLREIFWTPPISSNPPDLIRSLSDDYYFQQLPGNIKEFCRIFKASWSAYESNFVKNKETTFELRNWEANPLITGLKFETHLEFIQQLLRSGNKFKSSNSWELLEEYINFTFTYYNQETLSTEIYIEILMSCVKALQPHILEIVLNYRPIHFDNEKSDRVWYALFQVVHSKKLIITTFSNEAREWFNLFHLLCLNFGPNKKLSNFQTSKQRNEITYRLNHLIQLQPLLSAVARLDSKLIISIFVYEEIHELVAEIGISTIYFWIDRFLGINANIKSFSLEKEQEISDFADNLFSCISALNNLSVLIDICDRHDYFYLHQFILMHSALARNSISSKAEKCLLLQNLVQEPLFDFSYMKMVTIIAGFDLKWEDLEEHLLPSILPKSRVGILMQGLKFIMQVAESFPENFDPLVPWTSTAIFPFMDQSPDCPYLLDAGRIILARHFKILPNFTRLTEDILEDACFRDLCWFMNFFINLYRPDLGPGYQITCITE